MNRTKKYAAIVLLTIIATACNGAHQGSRMAIERLDIALADSIDHPQVIDRYAPAFEAITVSQNLDPRPDAQMARHIASLPYFKIFAPDVRRALPDLTPAEKQVGEAFAALSGLFDSIALPRRIVGYVSPYNQMIVRVDTVMLVALNHYLGPDYPGYSGFDLYLREQKRPARLPYDIVESTIRTAFPREESAYSTALQAMLYEGATLYTLMRALPDADLAEALGWKPEQLQWAVGNEGKIWRKLAADGLLFTTSKIDIAKLVDPSPATAIVNPEAPGRLGRYVGYRIVEAWMKTHPEEHVAHLFSPAFQASQSVLQEAKYTP